MPSKQLLAQMKFRPWTGVFLSDEYLSSVEAADAVTVKMLAMYHDAGVVPLVESKVAKAEHLRRAVDLLAQGCGQAAETLLPGLSGEVNRHEVTQKRAQPSDKEGGSQQQQKISRRQTRSQYAKY